MRPVLPALALMLVLSACSSKKEAEGAGAAAGEILPGSTSDAMLPLDTVRSQAPLAPSADGASKPGQGNDGASSQAAEDQPTVAAEPAAGPAEPAKPAEG